MYMSLGVLLVMQEGSVSFSPIIRCRSISCYKLQGERKMGYRIVSMKFIRSISYAMLNATSCHYVQLHTQQQIDLNEQTNSNHYVIT